MHALRHVFLAKTGSVFPYATEKSVARVSHS